MTISKGRRTHVKLIVLLRQSDFIAPATKQGHPWIFVAEFAAANDEESTEKLYRLLPLFSIRPPIKEKYESKSEQVEI